MWAVTVFVIVTRSGLGIEYSSGTGRGAELIVTAPAGLSTRSERTSSLLGLPGRVPERTRVHGHPQAGDLRRAGDRRLGAPHPRVQAVQREQFGVSPGLGDPAGLPDDDQARLADRAQPLAP